MIRALTTAVLLTAALAVPLAGQSPASAATCTTHLGGVCGPYSDAAIAWSNGFTTYTEDQDVGCGGNATLCNDTLASASPGNWKAVERINTPGSYCQQVRTFPSVQQQTRPPGGTGPVTLSNYKAIYSKFAITSPAAGSYEAAYDVWSTNETMIWLDVRNHDHGETFIGTMTIFGQTFHAYANGPKSNPGEIIVELAHPSETSGTVHILATLRWLSARGWEAPDPKIGMINFGWEVCGTGGTPQAFKVSSYTLTAVPKT